MERNCPGRHFCGFNSLYSHPHDIRHWCSAYSGVSVGYVSTLLGLERRRLPTLPCGVYIRQRGYSELIYAFQFNATGEHHSKPTDTIPSGIYRHHRYPCDECTHRDSEPSGDRDSNNDRDDSTKPSLLENRYWGRSKYPNSVN